MATQPKSYQDVLTRVRSYQSGLQKGASVDATDPREKGTATPPKTDGDSTDKTGVPAGSKSTPNQPAAAQLTDKDTKPSGTGEHVPVTPENGDAKDRAATAPNTDLSKIAAKATGIAARISSLNPAKAAAAAPAGGAAPAAAPAAPATTGKQANDQLAADALGKLTPEYHFKLASAMLSTESGRMACEVELRKQAGEQAANEIMANALEMTTKYASIAQAEDAMLAQELQAHEALVAQTGELLKSASAEDLAQIEKYASVHELNLAQIEDPILKMAYMQGAADGAAMQDSPEGQIPGGQEGPASLEEIAQILSSMVESGEIDEATATQVLKELAAGEQGGGAEAGAAAAPAGAAAPEAVAADESPEKTASAAIALATELTAPKK